MRRGFSILGGVIALSVGLVGSIAAASNSFGGFPIVRVLLNGQEVVSDVPAVNFHGRTMLPVRKLAELTGLNIDGWDAETATVTLSTKDPAALQAENERLKAELAQLKAERFENQAVASVNGEAISRGELYARLVANSGTNTLDRMINERLVEQAARQAGVSVTEGDIDREVEQLKKKVGGEAAFQQILKQQNLSLEQLRDSIALQLRATRVISRDLTVTEDDLKRFFEEHIATFDERQVHARHILLRTEAEAKAILAELEKSADFAALAKARSVEPAASTSGGDLGFFRRGQMVSPFEAVAFSLKQGEFSPPFETEFGWHIVEVLEVKGEAPAFTALRARVEEEYRRLWVGDRFGAWLDGLRREATIENSLERP